MPIKLLLLLIVAAALAALVYFARRRAADPRAAWALPPRRRHPVVRAVCAILGFGILGAVAVGTWLDARGTYAPAPDPAVALRLPGAPAPLPANIPEPPLVAFLKKGRFLVHVVVLQESLGELRPMHVAELELRLPEDRDKAFRPEVVVPGYDAKLELSIDQVQVRRHDGAVELNPYGWYRLEMSRRLESSSVSGSLNEARIAPTGRPQRLKSAFSIAPGRPQAVTLLCLPTLVSDGDPLRAASIDELLREKDRQIRSGLDPENLRVASRTGIDAPGLELLGHWGVTGPILLLAAVLLSQVARRKSLAFAGWLAAIVVLAGAMDRAALGLHAARLRDPQAPLRDRQRACFHMADTFFFRKTAARDVEKILQDPALRDTARRVLPILD